VTFEAHAYQFRTEHRVHTCFAAAFVVDAWQSSALPVESWKVRNAGQEAKLRPSRTACTKASALLECLDKATNFKTSVIVPGCMFACGRGGAAGLSDWNTKTHVPHVVGNLDAKTFEVGCRTCSGFRGFAKVKMVVPSYDFTHSIFSV
jgi:hypothetical protein